ncbi:MAG: hypothetical protein Ct9H300mP21_05240 [Pseudomonadota bacterium]|nr:MAG: hypothetical protein Ct9H300mP21_05240 [Pseudomonadota bacterium]
MGSGLRGLNFAPLPGAEKEGEVIKEVSDTKDRNTAIFSQKVAKKNCSEECLDLQKFYTLQLMDFFSKKTKS